jgi:hypothetical protein
MGVHRFYETLTNPGGGGATQTARELSRYYYDDISDEVMVRHFKVDEGRGAKPAFIGEHRMPVAQVPDDIRRQLERWKSDPGRNPLGIIVGGILIGYVVMQQIKQIIGSAQEIAPQIADRVSRTFSVSRIKSMMQFTR